MRERQRIDHTSCITFQIALCVWANVLAQFSLLFRACHSCTGPIHCARSAFHSMRRMWPMQSRSLRQRRDCHRGIFVFALFAVKISKRILNDFFFLHDPKKDREQLLMIIYWIYFIYETRIVGGHDTFDWFPRFGCSPIELRALHSNFMRKFCLHMSMTIALGPHRNLAHIRIRESGIDRQRRERAPEDAHSDKHTLTKRMIGVARVAFGNAII